MRAAGWRCWLPLRASRWQAALAAARGGTGASLSSAGVLHRSRRIMNGYLQHGLPSNPDKLLALNNKATINVSGQQFSALVIENFILRQPSSVKKEFWKCDVDVEGQALREVYGLKSSEPNIPFTLLWHQIIANIGTQCFTPRMRTRCAVHRSRPVCVATYSKLLLDYE